jgi:hypothetical protein
VCVDCGTVQRVLRVFDNVFGGRLNWTIARKALAREARSRSSVLERGREGVNPFPTLKGGAG